LGSPGLLSDEPIRPTASSPKKSIDGFAPDKAPSYDEPKDLAMEAINENKDEDTDLSSDHDELPSVMITVPPLVGPPNLDLWSLLTCSGTLLTGATPLERLLR
jgi:hypothetical protein